MYTASRSLLLWSTVGAGSRRPHVRRHRTALSFPLTVSAFRSERGASWGLFLSGIGILSLVVFSGLLYIHQVTSSAANGYDVVSLERKAGDLKEQERRLELEAAQLQSLKTIEENVRRLNFIPTDAVAFTSPIIEGTVAYSGGTSDF